jgi:hypothetical protein
MNPVPYCDQATQDESVFVLSQDLIGINFTSPTSGENLSGNITIKVNATLIGSGQLMLRWNNDSWIDITNAYNITSRLYEYHFDTTCLPPGNVKFIAKQVTSHGSVQSTVDANITWERPPILIVDDYHNATIAQYYTNALDALGYLNGSGYDVWRTQIAGAPDDTDLLDYQFAIWYKSDDSSVISSGERTAIQTFLSNLSSRKLLLTGTEIAWRAYNGGGYEAWLSSNFGVNDYIGDGSNSENLIGSVGGPLSGANYSYGGGDGSKAGGGSDWCRTLEFSTGIAEYQSSGYDEYAAIISPIVSGLFFGFAFDAISNSSDRVDLLNRTLSYFGIYDPPQTNVIAPIGGDLENSMVDLEWNSSSAIPGAFYNPSYAIFVDGQKYISGLSLENYTITLEQGNHTIRVVCEDNYGQRGYANVSIECDTILPQIEIVNHEAGSVLQSNTLLDFDLIDDHLQSAIGRWDSATWITFTPPYDTTLPSGDGNHTFFILAFDAAGNSNATDFTFICDDSLPDIELVDLVNGSILMSDVTINLNINDTHLDKAEYHWDLNSYSELSSPFEVTSPVGEGIHHLYINATDIAGNFRAAHYQFITDDTSPSISLIGITNGTILKSGSPMNLIVTDFHFENVSYQWDLMHQVFYGISDVILYAPLLEGEHWLFAIATDNAGNRAFASFVFIVDNTAPEILLISPPDGSSIPISTEVSVAVSDVYLDSVYFKWDFGAWNEWNAPYVTYSPTGTGFHVLFVNATDAAGNHDQSVFAFSTVEPTGTTTTSSTSTEPAGPDLNLPASLGIMGIGIYLGIVLAVFLWPRLKSRKTSTS